MLTRAALRLLYNLSFDARVQQEIVDSGFMNTLTDLLKDPKVATILQG